MLCQHWYVIVFFSFQNQNRIKKYFLAFLLLKSKDFFLVLIFRNDAMVTIVY